MATRYMATLIFPKKYLNDPAVKKQYNLNIVEKNGLIYITDTEAPNGYFRIESFFKEHKVPFDRHSESAFGYDSTVIHYRPELENHPKAFHGIVACNGDDEQVINVQRIRDILNKPNLREELLNILPLEYMDIKHYA